MLLVPYKRFRIRTKLSREQCHQRLVAVVQPQKVVPLFAAPNSSDNRLIFKGEVKPNRFNLKYINRSRPQSKKGDFVAISGRLQSVGDGTEIIVRATFDPLYAIWIGFCSLSLGIFGLCVAFNVMNNPNAPQAEKIYIGICGVLVFGWYVIVHYALFTYFFAKAITKPCEALRQLFENMP